MPAPAMKQMRNFLRFHMLENTCVCEADSRYSSTSAVSTVGACMLAGWAGSTDLHGETAPNILGTSTSHRYSETFTGCGLRNAHTRAYLPSPARPFVKDSRYLSDYIQRVAGSNRRRLQSGRRYLCSVHGFLLSAIGRFQLLVGAASGLEQSVA